MHVHSVAAVLWCACGRDMLAEIRCDIDGATRLVLAGQATMDRLEMLHWAGNDPCDQGFYYYVRRSC